MNNQKEQHGNPEEQFWRQKKPKVSHVVDCRWEVEERSNGKQFPSESYAFLPGTFILESKAQIHTRTPAHKLYCLLLRSAVRIDYVQLRFPFSIGKEPPLLWTLLPKGFYFPTFVCFPTTCNCNIHTLIPRLFLVGFSFTLLPEHPSASPSSSGTKLLRIFALLPFTTAFPRLLSTTISSTRTNTTTLQCNV